MWPLLRAGGDNARRNYLLHLFSNGGIDASVVIKRLRTETDREYAVRAGSVTARFYGTAEELLEDYAWYSKNPPRSKNDPPDPADPQRTWPVGQLKLNDFGLFDVYGNVWEWTQSPLRTFEPGVAREDVEDDVLRITDTMALVRRGGSFSYEAAMMRSAHRGPMTAFPTNRRDTVGFRVARTYAPKGRRGS